MGLHIYKHAGDTFSSRLKKAIVMEAKHHQAFVSFNMTFPPNVVSMWDQLVTEWDADKTKWNLYEEPVAGELTYYAVLDIVSFLCSHHYRRRLTGVGKGGSWRC